MKTIKSALLGQKTIIDRNPDALLFQLREIIKEHRALIIARILGDIPTYVDYKFKLKATKEIVTTVHDQLLTLKNDNVDLSNYDAVVQMVTTRATTHLTNEPFYKEIDEYLSASLVKPQMKFV